MSTRYFAYPMPGVVAELRMALYPRLPAIANRWNETMGIGVRFSDGLGEFLERCHKAGQTWPTPLLLKYAAGDFNALHQDLYGEHVFSRQVTILLSEPEKEFDGGEFVLTEQRPGCRRGRRWCRSVKATRWSSRCGIYRCRGRVAPIASGCGTG